MLILITVPKDTLKKVGRAWTINFSDNTFILAVLWRFQEQIRRELTFKDITSQVGWNVQNTPNATWVKDLFLHDSSVMCLFACYDVWFRGDPDACATSADHQTTISTVALWQTVSS